MAMITRTISIPPATDIENLIGIYRTLLDALLIEHNIPIPPCNDLQHPIPESEALLRSDFNEMLHLLRNTKADNPTLSLTSMKVGGNHMTLIFNTN